ncbi:hypothetical protein LQZ21_03865 [Treponema sp. TIM-1]|uniref:hypothetical protein n=1 Tax=Treponema sp. TIM-1 TaxID=2898417 RepID=UPI0039804B24
MMRFFISLGAAVLGILGMAQLLTGPRLGPLYDFLGACRLSPPVSGEITLIETDPQKDFFTHYFIEPETAASVLISLTEIDASALILQIPVAGLSFGIAGNAAELNFRFDEEFGLVKGNILNLFEAIRLGSIPPGKTASYVGELLNLTEQGKERLLSSLVPQEEAGIFKKAAAAFGRVWETAEAGYPAFTPDPDGVLRRMAPVLLGEKEIEHPVYTALKERYEQPAIEHTVDGLILRLVKPGDGGALSLPLDRNGAILIEKSGKGQDFKRVPLSLLVDYEEADRELYQVLSAADSLGIYRGISPEKHPPILYEYAFSLREELLREPEEEKKRRWIESRERYFIALEDFCYGPGEMTMVSAYEERIAVEAPEADIQQLRDRRDELIRSFRDIREKYNALAEKRGVLKFLLYGSFCILGPGGPEAPGEPTETEASAILANSLLSGNVIRPAAPRHILFWSLVSVGILCLCLVKLEPLLSLGVGFLLSVLIGVVFSGSFVLSAYWIDPFIPFTAAVGATLTSTLFVLVMNHRFAEQVRRAYGSSITPAYFKTLLRAGAPPALEAVTVSAAVIAVRNEPLVVRESQGAPQEAAQNGVAFREELSRWCLKAGGIMAGWEGDTAIIAFGSPPERTVLKLRGEPSYDEGGLSPVTQAMQFLTMLLKDSPMGGAWFFGIDVGECAFIPIPGSGYQVYGPAAACSRLLSRLAPRYKVPILVTRAVQEKAGTIPSRPVRISTGQKGSRTFYTLLIRGKSGKTGL